MDTHPDLLEVDKLLDAARRFLAFDDLESATRCLNQAERLTMAHGDRQMAQCQQRSFRKPHR